MNGNFNGDTNLNRDNEEIFSNKTGIDIQHQYWSGNMQLSMEGISP